MLVRAQQHQQQPAAHSDSAPQVSRRQLLGAAGLLCAAAGMAGQPLPAVAIVQTPDGFRSQVDRCVAQTGRPKAAPTRCGSSLAAHMHAHAGGERHIVLCEAKPSLSVLQVGRLLLCLP
jgi:hypothetical protein